jgi:hypothetical protein
VDVLFRPFGKISPIWGYFQSEPDTGFFLGDQGAIGARIEPGLDEVCKGVHRKNGHIRNVFQAVFVAMAGLVLARVLDPESAQQVVGVITGMGG